MHSRTSAPSPDRKDSTWYCSSRFSSLRSRGSSSASALGEQLNEGRLSGIRIAVAGGTTPAAAGHDLARRPALRVCRDGRQLERTRWRRHDPAAVAPTRCRDGCRPDARRHCRRTTAGASTRSGRPRASGPGRHGRTSAGRPRGDTPDLVPSTIAATQLTERPDSDPNDGRLLLNDPSCDRWLRGCMSAYAHGVESCSAAPDAVGWYRCLYATASPWVCCSLRTATAS
jgi:hypothetical protein